MERPSDNIDVVAELEALRPQARQAFVAELDLRVANGFPKEERHLDSGWTRLARKLRRPPWRQLAVPVSVAAVAAIGIATAVVSISESGSERMPAGQALRGDGEVHFDAAVPEASPTGPRSSGADVESQAGEASSGSVEYSSEPPVELGSRLGPYASRASRRRIERSARVVLATDGGGVRAAAARVFSVVHTYDGIVLRSSIQDRGEGAASASFDLLIPSGRLSDALASFSDIAEVRSRSDSTLDVTAPTIGLEEHLRDARARIEGLLGQLAEAESASERASAERELRTERAHAAVLRSRLAALQRRTHLARVSLRIEAGATAAGSDGAWGVDDALDDAGRILAVAAAVTVVGLAILLPLLVLVALAILTYRLWTRRSRERALDRAGPSAAA